MDDKRWRVMNVDDSEAGKKEKDRPPISHNVFTLLLCEVVRRASLQSFLFQLHGGEMEADTH